jgi:hypothetical protein
MAKVTIECTWEEETGDHWPPRFCTVFRDVDFNVTCLCGGNKFTVKKGHPDPQGVYRMKYSATPYFMVTCKKCGTTDMLYSGEGAPSKTTKILDSSKNATRPSSFPDCDPGITA